MDVVEMRVLGRECYLQWLTNMLPIIATKICYMTQGFMLGDIQ